jgi:uncharacterized NAD-dependent epimerase/dehydratase family protein
MLRPDQKLAIYLEGAIADQTGKMGITVLRFSPNPVTCVIDSQHAGMDSAEATRVPRSCPVVATVDEAAALGAEALVLGIAPVGGHIPEDWYPPIDRAYELGLSLINGLHDMLGPRYQNPRPGQFVWDIRREPEGLGVATGKARFLDNRRALMIGTDMSVGKMTAGLEIYAEAQRRGVNAAFVATGQSGITIVGSGVPLDAVRVDYAAGAIEREVLRWADRDLVIVEGQGSLGHPGSTANLPLLRGAMPTHLVLCARAGQTSLWRLPEVPIPPLVQLTRLYEEVAEACGLFPRPRTAAICLNTWHMGDEEAADWVRRVEEDTGLPTTDPVRFGAGRALDAILAVP